jgi:hypothetical protein
MDNDYEVPPVEDVPEDGGRLRKKKKKRKRSGDAAEEEQAVQESVSMELEEQEEDGAGQPERRKKKKKKKKRQPSGDSVVSESGIPGDFDDHLTVIEAALSDLSKPLLEVSFATPALRRLVTVPDATEK